jgi:hypothetical protein
VLGYPDSMIYPPIFLGIFPEILREVGRVNAWFYWEIRAQRRIIKSG